MPARLPVNADPWQTAIDKFDSRSLFASKMRSRDWASVPVEIRERAFFSAGVENARVLGKMQSLLRSSFDFADRGNQPFVSKQEFIAEMRKFLGAKPGDSRSLTDLESARRLGLIYDFHRQSAFEYGRWKMGQDPDMLEQFPAQEFIRVQRRQQPRPAEFWPARWRQAGGKVYDGRRIARKDSDVWAKLSRFDVPYPPFDFNSGMGVRDVSLKDARELGVMDGGPSDSGGDPLTSSGQDAATGGDDEASPSSGGATDPVRPQQRDFNDGLEASAADLGAESRRAIRRAMGDDVTISQDRVGWNGGAKVEEKVRRVIADPRETTRHGFGEATKVAVQRAPELQGKQMVMTHDGIRSAMQSADALPPVFPLDFRYAAFLWRDPQEVQVDGEVTTLSWFFGSDRFSIQLRALGDNLLELIRIIKPRWWNLEGPMTENEEVNDG